MYQYEIYDNETASCYNEDGYITETSNLYNSKENCERAAQERCDELAEEYEDEARFQYRVVALEVVD